MVDRASTAADIQTQHDQPLRGLVAVVAGASRGIGKGIAIELGLAGAHVILAGRSLTPSAAGRPGSLQETAAEITEGGGSATAVRCDLTDPADAASLFTSVGRDHAHINILVNSIFNAQEFESSKGRPFWEIPVTIWDDVVDVGTRSAYISAALAAPLMLGADRGLIVNVSGRGAGRYMYNVAYGVGKAGLDKMTRDMAVDLAGENVSVISLWPNVTRTETLDAAYASAPTIADTFGDPALLETPRYAGRVVVALANDEARMARSARTFWVAELGQEYGLVDENGRTHVAPEPTGSN